jgi:uncharacterized protein YndB with AHSA1/START domain
MKDTDKSVTLARTIKAPAQKVFAAWIRPTLVRAPVALLA